MTVVYGQGKKVLQSKHHCSSQSAETWANLNSIVPVPNTKAPRQCSLKRDHQHWSRPFRAIAVGSNYKQRARSIKEGKMPGKELPESLLRRRIDTRVRLRRIAYHCLEQSCTSLPITLFALIIAIRLFSRARQKINMHNGKQCDNSDWKDRRWDNEGKANAMPSGLRYARFASTSGQLIYWLINRQESTSSTSP